MKVLRNIFLGILIPFVLSFPIVVYLANTGSYDAIVTIMYSILNIITLLLVFVFYNNLCRINCNNYKTKEGKYVICIPCGENELLCFLL